MSVQDFQNMFPDRRIEPIDGMAVTADIWEQAHAYHRRNLQFHNLLHHGPGVVAGLEVIASDPPDSSVYILPGVAVDPTGRAIVLPQPVAYDIGHEMEGLLYLLLSYGESRPRLDDSGESGGTLYVHSEFSIAARAVLPNTPSVELARIRRASREDPFLDANDPVQPGPNQIDLRFRREIGAPRDATMGVCYLGNVKARKQGRGASYLAHTLNQSGNYRLFVNDDVPLAPGIETNTIIYLVGEGEFELSSGQVNGLSNYVKRGKGSLFVESIDAEAEATFMNLLASMDMEPEALPPSHRLLIEPYLFTVPPPGFDAEARSEVLVNDGVIFSACNYGLVWQGETRDSVPSREQIRSAIEWGVNIIAYACRRARL